MLFRSPDQPLGVGLRVSASAAASLGEAPALAELQALLRDGPYYVFTINGFPYGAFHGEAVKEGAYRPDWSEPSRLSYSNSLADILVQLLPDGMNGSISTVPGTFKPWASDDRVETIADNFLRHAAHLARIRETTGKTITLALEPEPCCLLETIAETIQFFKGRLFSRTAEARLAELAGLAPGAAEAALHRHLGLCYDVCHAAVEFEDADEPTTCAKLGDLRAAAHARRHVRHQPGRTWPPLRSGRGMAEYLQADLDRSRAL